jgi:hypothetical protein
MKYSARHLALVLTSLAIFSVAGGGCATSKESFETAVDPASPDAAPPGFGDPTELCEAAQESNSYVGCDAWPTPVANAVWSVFDFAVVVANAGDKPAEIVIDRAGAQVTTAVVAPNGITKIYLPWVPELKGKDADGCASVTAPLPNSVRVNGGAYHLRSSRPVTVYQFSALEYAPVGGPPKKDWTSCPGYQHCGGVDCFSYTNDASILFPTKALTGTYRISGIPSNTSNAYFAVTATKDGTNVTINLSASARVLAGGGLAATAGGGTLKFSMNAGDVVEVSGEIGEQSDLSGSLVQADKAVQVITGHPCAKVPNGVQACDHLEESVLPAETLGKHYFVEQPTGPYGAAPGHVVRLYGNVDNTTLTYPGGAPPNAPTKLNAGSVADLGRVDKDFEVVGDHEFAVSTFMLGGQAVDPSTGLGDPSQSTLAPVEQYRTKYVFLAPNDYETSYVDIVQPIDATLTLDKVAVTSKPVAIGASGFGVNRVRLIDATNEGAHVLEGSAPFGIQVVGYGQYTSYQYPGGLDLKLIAPAPPR